MRTARWLTQAYGSLTGYFVRALPLDRGSMDLAYVDPSMPADKLSGENSGILRGPMSYAPIAPHQNVGEGAMFSRIQQGQLYSPIVLNNPPGGRTLV